MVNTQCRAQPDAAMPREASMWYRGEKANTLLTIPQLCWSVPDQQPR